MMMTDDLPSPVIKAVSVNHNTSAYMELMVRSLYARHPQGSGFNFSLTIYDNASQDDLTGLEKFAAEQGILILQSGFTSDTVNNSHGEVLRRFVLENPGPTHYLFLDSDVCFLDDFTINTMLTELSGTPEAFGIGPRMSWDGAEEIPQDVMKANPDIRDARLHPCCALVKNTSLFRNVVEAIGLSSVKYLWANAEEYLDTFKLMTKVMHTHGLKHIISSKMVLHFFCVSYVWEPTKHWNEAKARRRDDLLEQFRSI
jgi:hypothetical protein